MKKESSVAFKDNTVSKEELPFKHVLYPGHYGTFFGFKKNEASDIYLCSCTFQAVQNYIKSRLNSKIPQNTEPSRMYILDSSTFPMSFVESLMEKELPHDETIIDSLSFKDNLCHECNKRKPFYSYCVAMYGTAFKQHYGWYINKQSCTDGIAPPYGYILKEKCPTEILELIEHDPFETHKRISFLREEDYFQSRILSKALDRQNRAVTTIIENKVRERFGFKRVGEAWVSETTLYYLIKQLFPNLSVLLHYRPNFLEGLELDIFIEDLNLGIEYQGVQHFKPVEHWGGEESYKKLVSRDKKKAKLCKANNVNLIYFNYDEDITEKIVKEKIAEFI